MNRLLATALSASLVIACGGSPEKPSKPVRPAISNEEPSGMKGIVEAHNFWRRKMDVGELAWSGTAAEVAQSWAEQLATEACEMRHNPDPARRKAFGENIYRYWSSRAYDGFRRDPRTVVDRWGAEGQWYDDETHTCDAPEGATCGHYTQLVWQYSTHVGCGRARCEKSEVWVCNYFPRGNYEGVDPY